MACPGTLSLVRRSRAWQRHTPVHRAVRRQRKRTADGGVMRQQHREAAELQAEYAAQTGDEYSELLAKGLQ